MCGFIGFISDINDKQNSFFFKKFEHYLNELNERGPDYTEVKKIIFKDKVAIGVEYIKNNKTHYFYANKERC